MDENPGGAPSAEALVSLGSVATREGARASAPRLRDALSTGSMLAGRYRIERFLARGGMGEVHEAHDELLDVVLAVKTLRFDLEGDPVLLRRFKRELLLARSITHPNVCRVHDLEVDRSTRRVLFFLTMELLAGETLRSRILARGRMTPEEALPLVRQMATALGAAHAAGIVHRDFKSGNVMLVPGSGGERVVVTDFGLAQLHGGAEAADLMRAGDVIGTPAYMAPEQVSGEPAGPAADLYALGVVLFEMVTGTLPFPTATLEEALGCLDREAPSPRTVVSELDLRWDEVIQRLLRKEPRERFVHAMDVVRALEGGTSAVASRYELPAERDAFIGREKEMADLAIRIDGGSRLLTLVGAGGSGKTRFARRFGWMALDRFPGGVWFCDLSDARSLDGILHAVATALDVPLGRHEPVAQLGHAIAGHGRCLVILDNFEQVVSEAEATLGRWLDRCAEACFVVTTREVLGVAGEELVAFEPLTQEDAEALFVVRAKTSRYHFEPSEEDLRVIARLVVLLDRLPLAIELAAARIRVLTPLQALDRMSERFKLLSGSGARHDRQATLRATLDWSWELLSPWERAALAQISTFEGGFTMESAEAVIDLSAWSEAPWVLGVVQALLDKSLVRPTALGRFELLVSVQEYAAEKLRTPGAFDGSGSSAELMSLRRHGAHFAERGSEEALEQLDRHGGVSKRKQIALEMENLVAACRRAVSQGDAGLAVATLSATWTVLRLNGPIATGLSLARAVAGIPELEPGLRASASCLLGQAHAAQGRMDEAEDCIESALALHRQLRDRRAEGADLSLMGNVHRELGRMDASRECYEAALLIHREVGNRSAEGGTINNLGNLHLAQGRMEDARASYEAALAIHREVGNRFFEGITLCNLGLVHPRPGEAAGVQSCMEAALAIHREVGNRRFEGITLHHLGTMHMDAGRMDEAQGRHEAALVIAREVGNRGSEGQILGSLGRLHVEQGRMGAGQACYESALAILREVRDPRSEGQVLCCLGSLHLHEGHENESRDCYERALAIHREVGDRDHEGATLGHLGILHFEKGRQEDARLCYESAVTILHEVGNRGNEGIVLGRLGELHAAAGHLGESRLAYTEGAALLRGAEAWLELGKLLCQHAEVEHLAGDAIQARATLSEVEALVAQLGTAPDSSLGLAVARVRELFMSSS